LCILAASAVAGAQTLSPASEFDLNVKSHRFGRAMRSYFTATANGLTFVAIGDNSVLLVSADADGRILHSRSDLASVHAQFYAACLVPMAASGSCLPGLTACWNRLASNRAWQ
jgi:hypothetical protein